MKIMKDKEFDEKCREARNSTEYMEELAKIRDEEASSLSKDEHDLRMEISTYLVDDVFFFTYDPDAEDIVSIDVYDVPDEKVGEVKSELWKIIDKYGGKIENYYVPHPISTTITLSIHPEYVVRNCRNCGNLIELDEINKNTSTTLCRHCNCTLFDGPDLYDAEIS